MKCKDILHGKYYWFVGISLEVVLGKVVSTSSNWLNKDEVNRGVIYHLTFEGGRSGCYVSQHRIFNTEVGAIEFAIQENREKVFNLELKTKASRIEGKRLIEQLEIAKQKKLLRATLEMFEYFQDHTEIRGMARWPSWEEDGYRKDGPCPICYYSGWSSKKEKNLCGSTCLVPIFAKEGGCQKRNTSFKTWCYAEDKTERQKIGAQIIESIKGALSTEEV